MSIAMKKVAIGLVAALSFTPVATRPAAAWCYGCGGGAAAAGLIGGLALGTAIANANQPRYYAAPADGGCWIERRPVYDQWGNFIGRRRIRVCP